MSNILSFNMENYYYKILLLSLALIFSLAFTNIALSKQEAYSVFAKLPILGEIEVQNIRTELSIKEDNIKYSYYVNPTKVVDFFDDKISSGYITGKLVNNSIQTNKYYFKSEKKDFQRLIQFEYLSGIINNITIEPVYDISKITKVSNKMIHESIDPVTMFYILTNYNLIKGCNRTIKVYDGKRRYNLILSNPIESDSRYSCTLTHQKISGYKPEKIRENKKYISELNFKLGNDLSYEFNEVSLRVDNTDLIIRKNN